MFFMTFCMQIFIFTRALVVFFFALFFYIFQGFVWKGCYFQGRQDELGRPEGIVRGEWDGEAVYCIGEFVDGKRHGHLVWYGRAGNVLWEGDWLRGEEQYEELD